MIINLSSPILSIDGQLIENKNLETSLPPLLHRMHLKNLGGDIIVINGPGSFNALRIGTLCLNLLNRYAKNAYTFYSVTKLDVADFLYKHGMIGKHGYLSIGQKKFHWKVNIETHVVEKVAIDEKEENYRFEDVLFTHSLEQLPAHFPGAKRISPNYLIDPNITLPLQQHVKNTATD